MTGKEDRKKKKQKKKRLQLKRSSKDKLVRLGSNPVEWDLPLFPLVTYSQQVRRCLKRGLKSPIGDADEDIEGSPLSIDLADCPGDVDIFKIVDAFCKSRMTNKAISVSNVVKLIATSTFLEMESLTSRALKFLEESVFNSLDNCLAVLATFPDVNDLSDMSVNDLSDMSFGERTIFDKCEKALLRKIEVNLYPNTSSTTMMCSVQSLLRVAQLLPPNVAKRIYQTCRREKFGLFCDRNNPEKLSLITHFTVEDNSLKGATFVPFEASQCIQWEQWIEELSSALPDWSRRSILLLHVAKSIHLENEVNVSTISWGFLSDVLVQVVDLKAVTQHGLRPSENFSSLTDMDTESVLVEAVDLKAISQHGSRPSENLSSLTDMDTESVLVEVVDLKAITQDGSRPSENFSSLTDMDGESVLVDVVDLKAISQDGSRPTENFSSLTEMDAEIRNLQRLVGRSLGGDYHWKSALDDSSPLLQAQDSVLQTVQKFKFETLLAVVRHFKDSGSEHLHIMIIAKILDTCLLQHLERKTFTVLEALLVYQEFPNDSRPSHSEIYHVFEDFLRRKALSPQEALELTKLLDYSKLSDEVVEKLMVQLQFNDCDSQFRERFMEKQQERRIEQERSKEELIRLRNEVDIQTTDLVKVRQELSVQCADLTKAAEVIQLAESKSDYLRRELEEKQRECQIDQEKSQEELSKLHNEHNAKTADLGKVRQELSVQTADLIKATEDIRLAKSKSNDLRRELEEKQLECRIDQEKNQEELSKLRNELNEINIQTADILVKVRLELSARSAHLTTATQDIRIVERKLEAVKRNLLEEREKTKELCKVTEEKRLAESNLKEVRRDNRLAESKLKDVKRDLEEEQEKTTCQICFAQPRDALSLPCMHFLYCFDCLHLHHKKSKTCPTCRGPTTGLLKCLLSI